jgi:hypothetical protein
MKEFENGWHNSDNWLLNNFDMVADFLIKRNLLTKSHAELMLNFYDVSTLKNNIEWIARCEFSERYFQGNIFCYSYCIRV